MPATTKRIIAALFFGFLMGIAAGLIGVGGGEFRIPILLYVLGLPVLTAIAVNLLVGFLTVLVSFLRRFQLGLFTMHALNIALIMSLSSILGSYIGAASTVKIQKTLLKKLLAIFLVIVGLKIGLEPFIHIPLPLHFTLGPIEETALAVLVGLAIGIISGMLGVAGGEFRIPALIYLFNFDIVVAGTTSLFVSIPTVATGFTKHHQLGHTNKGAIVVAVMMGASSVVGALIGASYAGVIEKDILKMLLGVILILATVRMVAKL
ncbi:MAG: sulfite exporter TauE/SafE family protein [Candidatus Bathyarchaeota archaeon]|nr:sulfite exporter TauE/SafE family protein [Candidatus Bathyarchaeota archaeon]